MDVVAKRHQDQLARIKETVRKAHDYFQPNYNRFNDFQKFVFQSSLTNDDITLLQTLGRPQLEFNVLEAYVSRLLGEFSKQEPAIEVDAQDPESVDPDTIKAVEDLLRNLLSDDRNHHMRYQIYKDLLSGGFSVLKVHTEYSSPLSMKQDICLDRAYDPTLCGFDPIARDSHKGDGNFCFELFPMDQDEFKSRYPDIKIDDISYRKEFGGFNWSYTVDVTKMLILCDFYEKKKKRAKIVQLNDNRVMPMDEYNKLVEDWNDISLPPAIVGKPRWTEFTKIVRYRLIENTVIEYEETDFQHLPLVFFDGNSVLIKTRNNGNITQVCRPYVYHAKGAQRLKNYAGISLANEIENIVQHKFAVAKEALPKEEDFLQAYKDVQKASVLVFNSVYEENPNQPINNPLMPIQKTPGPPEIMQGFQGSDSLIQNILGSYDSALGINNNQLSGVAVVEAATQSNAAAMPYIVGFMQGLQRAAEIFVDLLPKYYRTPRTIPMEDKEGNKFYLKINEDPKNPFFSYSENALNVTVKASASFAVQKSRTLMMVKELMGMSPLFAQFIADKGLKFVLDNMEGKGVEELKQMVDEWLQEQQQQKQMLMQQQMQAAQQNPAQMKSQVDMAKIQLDQQKLAQDYELALMKLEEERKQMHAKMSMDHNKNAAELLKAHDQKQIEALKIHADHYNKEMEMKILKDKEKNHESP